MNEQLAKLLGKVPDYIRAERDEIVISFTDATVARFYHSQDCCESVEITDTVGDWADLVGVPLLVAEERINPPDCPADDGGYGSTTWTFYTFRSINGSVDVRWYGTSNGYYSERVDLEIEEPEGFAELALAVAKSRLRCEEVVPGITPNRRKRDQ